MRRNWITPPVHCQDEGAEVSSSKIGSWFFPASGAGYTGSSHVVAAQRKLPQKGNGQMEFLAICRDGHVWDNIPCLSYVPLSDRKFSDRI